MVFGQLLGGMITRAGERMHEEQQKSYQEDLWKKQMAFQMAADWIGKNADLATDEELNAMMGNLGTIANAKGTKDIFTHFPRLARQMIPHVVRPEQVTAPTGGGVQTMGTPMQVTTPAQELPPPAMAGQPAPATPMPARPAEMSMQAPGQQMAPQMTAAIPEMPEPPEWLSADPKERRTQMALARLRGANFPEPLNTVGRFAAVTGINFTPYEVALARASAAGGQQAAKFSGKPITGKRVDGNEFSVWMSTAGPMEIGPTGMPQRYVPQPGDVFVSDKGETGQIKQDENGNWVLIGTKTGKVIDTGRKGRTPNVGPIAPPEVVKSAARRVLTGEFTPQTALQMVGGARSGGGIQLVQELDKQGGRVAPKEVRSAMQSLTAAGNLIDKVEKLVTDIQDAESIEDKVRLSAMLDGVMGAIAGTLSRSVLAERGVLTNQDVDRAKALVPGWKSANFWPEYADTELEWLRSIVEAQTQSLMVDYYQKIPTTPGAAAPTGGGTVKEGTKVPISTTVPERPAAMGGGKAAALTAPETPKSFPVNVKYKDGSTDVIQNPEHWKVAVEEDPELKVVK